MINLLNVQRGRKGNDMEWWTEGGGDNVVQELTRGGGIESRAWVMRLGRELSCVWSEITPCVGKIKRC